MPELSKPADRKKTADKRSPRANRHRPTVLINGSQATSLIRFRGKMIEAMVASGYRVHASAPNIDDQLAGRIRALGAEAHSVRLDRTGLGPVADLRYFQDVRRLLRETGADLCLSYTIKPNIWATLAARSLGVRSVSMVTGVGYAFIESRSIRQKLVQRVARLLYRAATNANDIVIFQNPDDREDFLKTGCLAEARKARMINGSGVDLNYYAPIPLPEKPVFLMAARLLRNKGVREYAEAALGILAKGNDARFLLAGNFDEGHDGIDPAELEGWISGGIEYLGGLEDVRPAIGRASVFVLPSYREGTPRSVLEAMAMRRPIVTTDVPGCRETVVDRVNGLLIPARDPVALANAMQLMIDRPDLRREMADQSLELCRSKYDVDRVNAQLLEYLAES